MGFLADKRILVVGVASERSIAWGVAKALHREGASLALTYQNDKLQQRVASLAAELDTTLTLPLDVAEDREVEALFASLESNWGALDGVVHAVAYAPREQLAGNYVDVIDREGFRIAHDISSYSLAALAKGARPLMQGRAGAILTLTYLGAVRTCPHYNVMGLAKASLEANVRYLADALGPEGIRVNGISAGPIKTLAAVGITDFRKLLEHTAHNAPLRRNVNIDEVGNAAAFLCSDLASGITGEIMYVDAGYNINGIGIR
jgi:enoyl-[acyl-carrier protein] reductase I